MYTDEIEMTTVHFEEKRGNTNEGYANEGSLNEGDMRARFLKTRLKRLSVSKAVCYNQGGRHEIPS